MSFASGGEAQVQEAEGLAVCSDPARRGLMVRVRAIQRGFDQDSGSGRLSC